MKIVLDSSTLILLAKIGLLRLVTEKFECIITEDVEMESTERKESLDAKAITQLIKENKIKIEGSNAKKDLEHEFRLGAGEASSLKLAREKNMIIGTDDKSAINACKIFDIKFVTAIDFVIKACEKGEISTEEAKTKINKLDEYGRYDTRIIEEAIKKVMKNE